MRLRINTIIGGRYRILKFLGEGNFGETYLAANTFMDSQVAVKRLKPEYTSVEFRNRFLQEAQTLNELNDCPQTAHLRDYFQEEGSYYMVQDYIKGENLQEKLSSNNNFLCEMEVTELLKDILIALIPVHQRGFIHRDIKPANLILREQDGKIIIIDFGLVKLLQSIESSPGTVGGTPGYSAPEQFTGRRVTSASDIYAIGIIGIQALTGYAPKDLSYDTRTNEIYWPTVRSVSESLKQIIQKMVSHESSQRYQSVAEVLEALEALNQEVITTPTQISPSPPIHPSIYRSLLASIRQYIRFWPVASLVILAFILFSNRDFFLAFINPTSTQSWCNKSAPNDDDLSCGEQIILNNSKSESDNKQNGVNAFTLGQYDKAIQDFEKARTENQNDPETLIYLENTKLLREEREERKTYTIAVAIPGKDESLGLAEEALRGVAQLQNEFNNQDDFALKVLIVNDKNNSKTVKELVEYLLSKDDVIAVIGHYASEVTQQALPVYQERKVVFISYGSTATRKKILGDYRYTENFFFRTVHTVESMIPQLINQLELEPANLAKEQKKVAVFYTPNSLYSHSAFEVLSQKLNKNNIIAIDLSPQKFDAEQIYNDIAQKAKALILLPDGRVDRYSFNNTLEIIDTNQARLPMGGNWVLNNPEITKRGDSVKNLWLSVPWNRSTSLSEKPEVQKSVQIIIDNAEKLWGTDMISPITAMSYDAALILRTALTTIPVDQSLKKQRLELQKKLAKTDSINNEVLRVNGISGVVSFNGMGDRKEPISRTVRIANSTCGFILVPIDDSKTDKDCKPRP